MCIGNRTFLRKLKCNWTRGHKWSTAMLLSITLGGFGADRCVPVVFLSVPSVLIFNALKLFIFQILPWSLARGNWKVI